MKRIECDVATIGAGVAGLAATSRLKAAGKSVVCLEATGRVGGRILTLHDPLSPAPIELGAEFVHGRPPETWELIRKAGLVACQHTSCALHIDRGRILKDKEVGELADRVLSKMAESGSRKDETFEDYLRRSRQPADVKDWARVHVEGFNAAHQERISVASLKQDAEAAEKIDGERAFRILSGYDSIPLFLLRSIPDHESTVHLNSVVECVKWRRGSAEIHFRSSLDKQTGVVRCRQLIVTAPLGVLQATAGSRGAIRFDPEPGEALKAAATLQFGQVYRVTFRFRNPFWEANEKLKDAGFLVSRDKGFFTWWTSHPVISPLLTGWSAGSAADQFYNAGESRIVAQALDSLGRILGRKAPSPEAVYFHDWQADRFFRGAYSYAPVGGLAARNSLARPIEGTLFFAGEAAEAKGHSGTVHGAIASGIRTANLILDSGRRSRR